MYRRLMLALLALGAVFAVHGVQCLAAESTHGQHAMPLAASSGVLVGATSSGTVPGDLPDAANSATGDHTPGHTSSAPTTALPGGPHGSSHDTAGHPWAVCLAVLAAGLALGLTVLVARLARRVVQLTAPGLGRRPGSPDHRWARLLRPPDLSQLCLLRI